MNEARGCKSLLGASQHTEAVQTALPCFMMSAGVFSVSDYNLVFIHHSSFFL